MSDFKKTSVTTKGTLTTFTFGMAPSSPDFPIAFSDTVWDIVKSDTNLLTLMGEGAGQYSQSDINEKIAANIASINGSGNYRGTFKTVAARTSGATNPVNNDYCIMESENGSGIVTYTFCKYDADDLQWKDEYTWKGVSATFSGTGNYKGTFSTKAALDATTAEKSDYALLDKYQATTDETAQSGKTYYNVNGELISPQPTVGTNIKNSNYYEKSGNYDLYRYIPTKYIVVGNVAYIRDKENDDLTDYNTSHPAIYCWTNGNTHIYTKTEDVTVRSGSASDSNTAYTTSEATAQVGGSDSGGILQVSNWYKQYELKEDNFMPAEWALVESGEIEKALSSKISSMPKYSDIKDALDLIPEQAYDEGNELADKEFVNSSISTNTATFRGTYESVNALPSSQTGLKANDYAFVIVGTYAVVNNPTGNPVAQNYMEKSGDDYYPSTDTSVQSGKTYYVSQGNPEYKRYKWSIDEISSFEYSEKTYERDSSNDTTMAMTPNYDLYAYTNENDNTDTVYLAVSKLDNNGEVELTTDREIESQDVNISNIIYTYKWLFEYTLNNSSFTATQWTTINSGLTKAQQAYIANELSTKAASKFTVNISQSKSSIAYDDTSSYSLVLTALVKFDGQLVDIDNFSDSLELAGWVKTQNTTGTYTKTLPGQTGTSSITSGDSKVNNGKIVFTYTVDPDDADYGAIYGGTTLSKTIENATYSVSYTYPMWIGLSTASYASDLTNAQITTIKNNLTALPGESTTRFTSFNKSLSVTSTATTQTVWIITRGTPSIKSMGAPDNTNAVLTNKTITGNNSVDISGYNVKVSGPIKDNDNGTHNTVNFSTLAG